MPPATILVVDDSPVNLQILVRTLDGTGHRILAATAGKAALEIALRTHPDLILLDVMMPVMDGLEVCQELKKVAPSVPIILLTARDDMMTRAAAMDLGVSEFVAKPVNNKDLLDRVRTQLRNLEWDKATDQVVSKIERSERTPGKT